MSKINKCKTCNGYGRIGSNLHGGVCAVCEGTGLDMNQIKSRCEYYGAEYQCNISTSDIMEYKDECASFFGKSKFKMLERWKQSIINQSFKKRQRQRESDMNQKEISEATGIAQPHVSVALKRIDNIFECLPKNIRKVLKAQGKTVVVVNNNSPK